MEVEATSAPPRWASRIETGALVLAAIGTVLLMAVTVVDVTLRATTGRGIPGAIEITEVVLVVAAYLGLMTAAHDRMHVTVTFVTARMPSRMADAVRVLAGLVSLATLVVVLVATAIRAVGSVSSGEFRFGLVSVPIWPARVAIVIGLATFAVAACLQLIESITRLRRHDGALEVGS